MRFATKHTPRIFSIIVLASILILGMGPFVFRAEASSLQNRRVVISDATKSANATYLFEFGLTTNNVLLGSIQFEFCSNTALLGEVCVPPTGFDASSADLVNQAGVIGFSISPISNANTIVLTRTTANTAAVQVSYRFDNIINPSSEGPFYVRIQTYASEDATGAHTDYGGLAVSVNEEISISAEVPPYLLFCGGIVITDFDCTTSSGNFINFGELSTNQPKTGTTQILIATNAANGYTLSVTGTTMLSGTNVIPAIASQDVSRPGTSQFGINMVNNSDPNVGTNPIGPGSGAVTSNYGVPNRYQFVSGDILASASAPEAYRKFTVTYLVNVALDQEPGVYVATLTYVAVASF